MFVCLCKPALKDEPDDRMAKLPTAMCEDVWWGRDSELFHICIGEVVRQLWGFGSSW